MELPFPHLKPSNDYHKTIQIKKPHKSKSYYVQSLPLKHKPSSIYSPRQTREAFLIAYGDKGVESGKRKGMKLLPPGRKGRNNHNFRQKP